MSHSRHTFQNNNNKTWEVFKSHTLIDWCLMPTLAAFQLNRGVSTDIQHFKLSNIFFILSCTFGQIKIPNI